MSPTWRSRISSTRSCSSSSRGTTPRRRRARERQSEQHEQRAEPEEAEIPWQVVCNVVAHVVDAENLVVDDPFDEVEGAPADDDPARESVPRFGPAPRALVAPPEQPDAASDSEPGEGVEETVGNRVLLQVVHACRREPGASGQHVVPLEDLVEHDAVHEPAEPDPK